MFGQVAPPLYQISVKLREKWDNIARTWFIGNERAAGAGVSRRQRQNRNSRKGITSHIIGQTECQSGYWLESSASRSRHLAKRFRTAAC